MFEELQEEFRIIQSNSSLTDSENAKSKVYIRIIPANPDSIVEIPESLNIPNTREINIKIRENAGYILSREFGRITGFSFSPIEASLFLFKFCEVFKETNNMLFVEDSGLIESSSNDMLQSAINTYGHHYGVQSGLHPKTYAIASFYPETIKFTKKRNNKIMDCLFHLRARREAVIKDSLMVYFNYQELPAQIAFDFQSPISREKNKETHSKRKKFHAFIRKFTGIDKIMMLMLATFALEMGYSKIASSETKLFISIEIFLMASFVILKLYKESSPYYIEDVSDELVFEDAEKIYQELVSPSILLDQGDFFENLEVEDRVEDFSTFNPSMTLTRR